MRVTDQHVATLRAQLSQHFDEHKRLFAQNEESDDRLGYGALVSGAFFAAMERCFGAETTEADIIRFVADVRSRTEEAARNVDADSAEGIIAAVAGLDLGTDVDDIETTKMTTAMLYMMTCADVNHCPPPHVSFMCKRD